MIDRLFDRMDKWRHLPNYQLERRADVFFSLYLPDVLKAKTGTEINPVIIPEFPVRIGTIYPHIPIDKSFKIDYVCFSADGKIALFVELKTDNTSRRQEQDRYLMASCKAGFASLVEGVIRIFKATNAKRKYFCLLDMLAVAGFVEIPAEMYAIVQKDGLQGINSMAEQIKILDCPDESRIIYIQPDGTGSDVVSFDEFGAVVSGYDDAVSRRFCQSLKGWGSVKAGYVK